MSNKIIQRPKKEITSHILRNTILLVGNSIVFACILQIILTVSPLIIIESTNSITLASLATAVVLSCDIPTNYHAGKLADTIGRKKTLLIGILIGLAGLFTMTLSRLLREDNFYWLGLVIFGLSTGFFVLNRAAIMDMYPQNRGKSLGYLQTGSFIGSLMGPILISGITALAIRFGKNYYDFLTFTCLPLLAFAGFLIFVIRIDTKIIAQSLENRGLHSEFNTNSSKEEPWTSVLQNKRDLLLAFVISSLSVVGVSIVYSLCPIFLNTLKIEIGWISFAVALVGLGTGGVSILSGKLSDKFGRKKTILAGALIMGTGLFVFLLTQNYMIVSIASFLVGLGAGAVAIASTSMICDMVAPRNRGKVFGANSLVINIFTFIFPPLAATLFTSIGPFSISILGIALAAIVLLSLFFISQKSISTM